MTAQRAEPAVRTATVKDVAAAAGVSTQTVSRVLAGSPAVAGKTRERVETGRRELGVPPDPAAQALAARPRRRPARPSQTTGAALLASFVDQARRAGWAVRPVVLDGTSSAMVIVLSPLPAAPGSALDGDTPSSSAARTVTAVQLSGYRTEEPPP
jgi:hypothetical protein